MDPVVVAQHEIGTVTLIVDLVLKAVGAGGVLAILFNVVRFAHRWGQIERAVHNGFTENAKSHMMIETVLTSHNAQLIAMTRSIGRLEGRVREDE